MKLKRLLGSSARQCSVFVIIAGVMVSDIGFARQEVDDSTGETIQNPAVKGVQEDSNSSSGEVGPGAAQKYFRKNSSRSPSDATESPPNSSSSPAEEHYLALGIGGFVSGDSYSWGMNAHNGGVGGLVGELTYRIGHLSALADWALRADLMGYQLPDGRASQLAISPCLMFPDSSSHFPLYFGIGAGPGIFLQQISQSSTIAINYQLFAGIRFFDVIDNAGFFLETGLKNMFLLTSQGQFNGAYLTAGAVFAF
jgi:hypothetical protein